MMITMCNDQYHNANFRKLIILQKCLPIHISSYLYQTKTPSILSRFNEKRKFFKNWQRHVQKY